MHRVRQLTRLKSEIIKCDKCHINKLRGFGTGNIRSNIMILAQNPGKREKDCAESHFEVIPFGLNDPSTQKYSGIYMTKLLDHLNITLNDFYITNTIKCPREDSNAPPKHYELVNCSEFLNKEIEIQSPKLIIGLGSSAKYVLDCFEYGKVYTDNEIQKICIWHPGYVNRSGGAKYNDWLIQISPVTHLLPHLKFSKPSL